METRGLLVRGSSPFVLPNSIAQCQQQQDARSLSIPSTSREMQWTFRVERTRRTLLSGRRNTSVDVRAKKSAGASVGSSKGKTKESEAEEDDAQPAAGSKALFKLPGTTQKPSLKGGNRSKDNNTVFVAGATGKVGRRTVKELVKQGYNVRAGVRNPDKAQFLLGQEDEKEESAEEEAEEQPKKKGLFGDFSIEKLFGFLGPKNKREGRVELVQCDLEKSVEDIEEALGNAGVVICTIGASEKEVLDVTGPYRIDYKATKNLIDAATSANVNHFILVTSLGTKKFGWPAALLNLFWGVLFWKAKAEDALVASGIPFTIVRPGGMERPTDAYKETHNLRLSEADTLSGGQVSNLQVAELMAAVVGNLDLARNKILEAVAETTAPLRPFDELLAEIPSVGEEAQPVKSRSEVSQTANQQKEEDRGTAERERTEAIRQRLQEQYEAARLKEEEARREAEAARAEKAEIEKRTAELRSKLQAAEQSAREAKALETALIAAARQGKKLSEREKQDIIASVRAEMQAEQKAKEAKQKALEAPKEKPKVEATVKPPTKSKAEVAAESRAKQEAERKAREKEEADLRAKQEAEAKAKEEAEAKAKADAEAAEAEKQRIEAELKAKEEDEKRKKEVEEKRVEDERKAKEEEEKRIEAEKKAKQEEEEERLRIEAETKAQEEEEERLRIEAEKKAQEEQEKQAVANASPKGFRWPWQQDEPEEEAAAPAASSSAVEEKAAAEQPEAQELPRPSRPLSPYIQFPSLKPPTPPSPPQPPATAVEEDVSAKGETTVSQEPAPVKEGEEVAPEESILQKKEETPEVVAEDSPKGESSELSAKFRWPWEQPDREEECPKEGATAAAETGVEETASINQTIPQEEGSKRNTGELPRPSRPLSPFAAYPALKPPTPPSPPKTSEPGKGEGQPEASGVAEVASSAPVEFSDGAPEAQPQKTRPLSPFFMYPGLKPPQPPSPPVAPVAENPKVDEPSNMEEASWVVETTVTR